MRFLRRFAPREAPSRHEFLHDFNGVVKSSLDAGRLDECVEAYTEVLAAASALGLTGVAQVLSASELMLGNLGRSRAAGVRFPPGSARGRLTTLIRGVLKRVNGDRRMTSSMDAFKRLEAIEMAMTAGVPGRTRRRDTLRSGGANGEMDV